MKDRDIKLMCLTPDKHHPTWIWWLFWEEMEGFAVPTEGVSLHWGVDNGTAAKYFLQPQDLGSTGSYTEDNSQPFSTREYSISFQD